MAVSFENSLVIGISSRALFDLQKENEIYERDGLQAYADYQIAHENDVLKPGSGFPLVKALLQLNRQSQERLVEVIVMSRNSADTSLRIFHSIEEYGLDITRAALVGGTNVSPYLSAFAVDLFLSADEADVQNAIDHGFAAAQIYTDGIYDLYDDLSQIKIAFDGDAVLFSDEAEAIYQRDGLEAFAKHEQELAHQTLHEGPFAKLLKTLAHLQKRFPTSAAPIRTALVTARNAPAHERVIRTLRAWDVRIDEAFFLGGVSKKQILQAFGAHIFFDDQRTHLDSTALVVPSARVPYITHR
ncbi:MAG: 5'-nucleotidase [Erysipelotrichaceae bacterium]|nr:5'-nucleotidase [Erysipelotrichaceae bacterium]MCI9311993.1 5'-nucleotidase [Erysipelotrichaceae bacterium]